MQSWEKMGLPVRRIGDGPRAPVVAVSDEVDVWVRSAPANEFPLPANADQISTLRALIKQSRDLRLELRLNRSEERIARQRLVANATALKESCALSGGQNSSNDLIH